MTGLIVVDNSPRDFWPCLAVAEKMNLAGVNCLLLPWSTPHDLILSIAAQTSAEWILLSQYRRQFTQLFLQLNQIGIKIFVHESEGYPYSIAMEKWANDFKHGCPELISRYYSWGSQQKKNLCEMGILKASQVVVSGSLRHSLYSNSRSRAETLFPRTGKPKVLFAMSSNLPTPLMQTRIKEISMYTELVGREKAIDFYDIHVSNREHLFACACLIKHTSDYQVSIRSHPFADSNVLRQLSKNYGIEDHELHSPDERLLIQDLCESDLVITMGSTTCLEAHAIGRKVVSLSTVTYCESPDLANFYSTSDFSSYSISVDSVNAAVITSLKILGGTSTYTLPIVDDPMYEHSLNSLDIIAQDILCQTDSPAEIDRNSQLTSALSGRNLELSTHRRENLRPTSPERRYINATSIRQYLRLRPKPAHSLIFAPQIHWVCDNQRQLTFPVVEARCLG